MTMTQLDDYYPDAYSQPLLAEPVSDDYAKLLRCLWLFGGSLVLAGLIYFFLNDIKIAAGVCGLVAVVLAFAHTSFGLFVLFSLFSIENAVVLNPYFTISKAMGIIVLLSFILHMYRTGLIISKPAKLLMLFVLWGTLSVVWSMHPLYTTLVSLTFILNMGLIIIVLNTIKDQKSLFLVISGFAAGSIVASLMVLSGQVAQQSTAASGITRAALHGETNTLVLALSLGLGFIAACFAFFQPGKIKKIIAPFIICLLFIAMVKTQSRMPIFAALSVPVFALILCSQRQKRMKYILIASLIVILAVVSVQWAIQSDLMDNAARERLVSEGFEESGRLMFWKIGFESFIYRPFHGYGLNNFELIPMNPGGRAAHNNVVAVAVDLGLIGLTLVASIFIILYKQIRRISDSGLKWFGMTMLLYPLMTGITVTNYVKKEFWYSMALAITVVNIGKIKDAQAQSQPLYLGDQESDMTSYE